MAAGLVAEQDSSGDTHAQPSARDPAQAPKPAEVEGELSPGTGPDWASPAQALASAAEATWGCR